MGKAQSYLRGASLPDRFWAKVSKAGADDCWTWLASLDSGGYGNFGMQKDDGSGRFIMQRAHRIAWQIERGPIAHGLVVCHTCDNRRCVNPQHLFLGLQRDNMDDCSRKGRIGNRKGEMNGRARLTEQAVLTIRKSSQSLTTLAAVHQVSKSTVQSLKSGKTWSHL